jgi:peptidoglycan/LPS O-acetylase OafA/YrhL
LADPAGASWGACMGAYLTLGSRPGHIPALDGLRAVAILLVLLRHAARPVIEQHGQLFPIGSWDLAVPLLNGWAGVDLFFVLSGFLITLHLLKRWPDRWSLSFVGRYWVKRVLRTFPAYFSAVAIAWFGLIPLYEVRVYDTQHALYVHALFLQDYFGSELAPAFWSLGVEEKFYIACPFVLAWVLRQSASWKLIWIVCLATLPLVARVNLAASTDTVVSSYEAFFWSVRAPFHLAMDGLWIGVLCALVYTLYGDALYRRPETMRRVTRLCLLVLGITLGSVAWFDERHDQLAAVMPTILSLAFGGLLLSVCDEQSALGHKLQNRGLRMVSEVSYSVYLLHLMLVPLVLHFTGQLVDLQSASPLALFALFLPLFTFISLVAGYVLHVAVEKPFLRLKEQIRL